jgi:hypothetical protein
VWDIAGYDSGLYRVCNKAGGFCAAYHIGKDPAGMNGGKGAIGK